MNQHDHRAQHREAPEPEEGTRAIPKIVLAWIAILIVWGVGYYAWQIGKPLLGGDSRTPVATAHQESRPADGAVIFSAQCSACHQANGQGVPGAFPPLAGSEWMLADAAIAIVHDGLQKS